MPHYDKFMEEDRLYQVLVAVAQSAKRRVLTYTEAGATVGRAANDPELFEHLDEINRFERRHGRPMLTALVVGKQTGMPGRGFFRLASSWGADTRNHQRFWKAELKRVRQHWRASGSSRWCWRRPP